MKKVLAVSGGIDSVVMLHLFRDDPDVVVAHFNHNIRNNSAEDCNFVAKLARKYHRDFVSEEANLGIEASEAEARRARYEFLNRICTERKGRLYVAHHKDDVYETIAINILRGTGWRGLAPLQNPDIERPLLEWSKKDIYLYATKNQLSFRQDQTNTEDTYLRNRVRERLRFLTNEQKKELDRLYQRQCKIGVEISQIIGELTSDKENIYFAWAISETWWMKSQLNYCANYCTEEFNLSDSSADATCHRCYQIISGREAVSSGEECSY